MTQKDFIELYNANSKNIFEFINKVFEKVVPASGKADTIVGEIVRAMGRIGFRWVNDGDVYYEGYGLETVAPSMQYLLEIASKYEVDNEYDRIYDLIQEEQQSYRDDDYEENIESIFKLIIEILSDPENEHLFTDSNEIDSRLIDADDFEMRQRLYDMEFYIDDDIDAESQAYSIKQFFEDLIANTFGYERSHEIDIDVNTWNKTVQLDNLTKDEFEEIQEWNNNRYFWEDFKETYMQDDLEEDLDKKSYDEYYEKCKKVKEDYFKFAHKKDDLKEDFDETNLDENALKECAFKYNMGKRQVIEMIKDVR